MVCSKCGFGQMVDDSNYRVKVYRCWACGNRVYVDHPKRLGFLVCTRCGSDVEEQNEFGFCNECLRLLLIQDTRTKGRKNRTAHLRQRVYRKRRRSDVALEALPQ